jgi:hypothetical protein
MLSDYPDWTDQLGYAFATQQADVTASIQRLRAQAQAAGSLTSTPQQQVVADTSGIQIVPANPQVIYVPVYDPQVVFGPPPPGVVVNAGITFGPAFPVGVWLTNDFNWGGGYVVVGGGWRYRRGGGWVSVNNNPAFWPRSRFRYRPGWDGRPSRWRPPPGRPTFRPPSRPPGRPGKPWFNRPGFNRPGGGRPPARPPGRPPGRPGAPVNRPGPPTFNRPRSSPEERGRASGRPSAPTARPGRTGALADIDRPNPGQRESDRGRQSRSARSTPAQPSRGINPDASARSAAQNSARGAQSRASQNRGTQSQGTQNRGNPSRGSGGGGGRQR